MVIIFFIVLDGYFFTLGNELFNDFPFSRVGAQPINNFKSLDVVEVIKILKANRFGLQ